MNTPNTQKQNSFNDNYRTVSERITVFREKYPAKEGWGLVTETEPVNENRSVFKAVTKIMFNDQIISMGSAERYWTHECPYPLEYAETASVGRALAFIGIGSELLNDSEGGLGVGSKPDPNKKEKTPQVANLGEYKNKNKDEPEDDVIVPQKVQEIFDFIGIKPLKGLKYTYDEKNNHIYISNPTTEVIRHRKSLLEQGFEMSDTNYVLDLKKIKERMKKTAK